MLLPWRSYPRLAGLLVSSCLVGCGSPPPGAPADLGASPDLSIPVPPRAALDPFGGAFDLPIANTTGYFTVANAFGRAWLVTPAGHAFVSMGVNNVGPVGDPDRATGKDPYGEWVKAHYPGEPAWRDATASRLASWTFNTLGAWSRYDLFAGRMAQTPVLSFAGSGWSASGGPDVFDPAWAASAQASAKSQIGARAADPYIIGWFLDNELRWGPDWKGPADLFDAFLSLPEAAPGKAALVAAMKKQFGGEIGPFNAAFGTTLSSFAELTRLTEVPPKAHDGGAPADDAPARDAWTRQVAARYFEVTSSAVRAADPPHLVLGCRFVSWVTPPGVVDAAGPYLDVVSVNHYEIDPTGQNILDGAPYLANRVSTSNWLAEFAKRANRPLLISEFGARAADSGLPNTYPPYFFQVVWDTQSQRADALERYGEALAAQPYLVGIHWFEWFDEPPGGRFDGENSNWGLVSSEDVKYTSVVDRAPLIGPMLTYWKYAPGASKM